MRNAGITVFFFLFLLLFLAGCAADAPSPIVGTPRRRTLDITPPETGEEPEPVHIPYAVLFPQAGASLSLHEPINGAYLGAWLSENMRITMRSFGNLAEKPHAIFTHEMQLGDEIPLIWLLQAIAADAAPLFYLRASAEDFENGFPLDMLVDLARELEAYDIPMFVAFLPPENANGLSANAYISAYRLARIIFRSYAPQAAFVWVPPSGHNDAVTPAHPFYPGHDVVDWVGIPALALRERDVFSQELPAALDDMHRAFQRHKPIMLLPLGISHFSRTDYTYYINEAAEKIRAVYAALPGFPRIKAVVYRDAKNIGPHWDDMTLTLENDLMTAYAEAVGSAHFLSFLAPPLYTQQWLRSTHHGYFYDGELFVDYETLTGELFISRPGSTVNIDGRNYVNTSSLSLDITVNHEYRIIYINLPS